MIAAFEDLFQRPYYYLPSPLTVHPMLASEIVSLVRRSDEPYFRYEALTLEPPGEYRIECGETGQVFGFGASFTNPADALAKSVFEAWERRFSKVYDPASLVFGSYHELAPHAVDPQVFTLISPWEYGQSPLDYVRYTPDLRLSWKECSRVVEGSLHSVLIPATLVYSRFSWKNPAERFVPNLSPGLACHFSYRDAILSGLCELLERDAFMLTWLLHRSPPHIRLEATLLREAGAAHRCLRELGFVIHFLNITTDLDVPVVLTLIEHAGLPWHGALVPGLGCHPDPVAALHKSFLEALVMLSNFATIDVGRSEVLLKHRSLGFGLKADDYYRRVRFLLDSSESIAIDAIRSHDRKDSGRNLQSLLDSLNARGHATYLVDLTPPAYDDCRLCLTRSFIAGLQPMLYEPDCWRLNPKRLFGDVSPAFEKLNLLPHPFMLMD